MFLRQNDAVFHRVHFADVVGHPEYTSQICFACIRQIAVIRRLQEDEVRALARLVLPSSPARPTAAAAFKVAAVRASAAVMCIAMTARPKTSGSEYV